MAARKPVNAPIPTRKRYIRGTDIEVRRVMVVQGKRRFVWRATDPEIRHVPHNATELR